MTLWKKHKEEAEKLVQKWEEKLTINDCKQLYSRLNGFSLSSWQSWLHQQCEPINDLLDASDEKAVALLSDLPENDRVLYIFAVMQELRRVVVFFESMIKLEPVFDSDLSKHLISSVSLSIGLALERSELVWPWNCKPPFVDFCLVPSGKPFPAEYPNSEYTYS